MTKKMDMAFVLRADVEQARQAMQSVRKELGDLRGASKEAAAGVDQSAQATGRAAAAARQKQEMLEQFRARVGPLNAALRQYEQQLRAIADAERQGAISAKEAAAARKQASAALPYSGSPIDPMRQGPANMSAPPGSTGGIAGLGAGIAALINPITLATMAGSTLGATLIRSLVDAIPRTKSLSDAMSDLSGSVERVSRATEMARMSASQMRAEFGSAGAEMRGWLTDMAELERRQAQRDIDAASQALARSFNVSLEEHHALGGSGLGSVFEIDNNRDMQMVRNIESAVQWLNNARQLEHKLTAATTLRDRVYEAAMHSGSISGAEDSMLREIDELLVELRKLETIDTNSAGLENARQLTRELERRVALEEAAALHGRDSVAVSRLQADHQRELTRLQIEGLGLSESDAEARELMRQTEALIAAERQSAQSDWRRAQEQQIAGIELQAQMIGRSTAEQHLLTAAAQAEIDARTKGWEAVALARNRANAQIALDRARFDFDQANARKTDELDLAAIGVRDPVGRAAIEGQREYNRLVAQGVSVDQASAAAGRVRARLINEAVAQGRVQLDDMMTELAIRQRLDAEIAAGNLTAAEANSALQQELTLRPLIAAAARAEGDEKRRLTELVTGLRIAYELVAENERRMAANAYLRGQEERAQSLRVEQALLGQNEETRARVLALIEAEQQIRVLGLDTGSAAARQIREQARANAELAGSIREQARAWEDVRRTAEDAIGTAVDGLTSGRLRDAAASIIGDIGDMFTELAVKNPLRNAILGTSYATLDSMGGMRGILGRLTGKQPLDEAGVIAGGASPVQAMQIEALQVTINAANIGLGLGAAVDQIGAQIGAPVGTEAAQVGTDVVNFLRASAVGGGLRADALTGMHPELANPLAAMMREAQQIFGSEAVKITSAYRSNQRQQELWDAALAKHGSPEAARRWVAPPGGSRHNHGLAADLRYSSPEVQRWMHQNAARYGLDYRMSHEPWHIEPRNAAAIVAGRRNHVGQAPSHAVAASTAEAQAGVEQLGRAATKAGQQVGEMGTGMSEFGGALGSLVSAGLQGGSVGVAGVLLQLGAQWISSKVPGFARGGATGGSDPARIAGVVHEQEYVFDAASTRRIGVGNLEALRRGLMPGYSDGGFVGSRNFGAAFAGMGIPAGGDDMRVHMSFDLRGAEGDASIERKLARAMDGAQAQLIALLPDKIKLVMSDPRLR